MNTTPPNVYVAGIGGFAERHHEALYELEAQGLLRVRAVCDPGVAEMEEIVDRYAFGRRGIKVYRDFDELLAEHASDFKLGDWASIAAPISYHANLHRSCVEHGLACYLEKPPTLDPDELEQMIERDREAVRPTAVGFNHIGQPPRLRLKQRIIDGELGALQSVRFVGAWRRSSGYFQRNAWAGKFMLDEQLILDSCLGNGMAHHIHNLLFFCGTQALYHWGSCESLESELYAVNASDGPDTLFVKGQMQGGATIRLALTNAYDNGEQSLEELDFEKARVVIHPSRCIEIFWEDGRGEFVPLPLSFPLEGNFRAFLEYLQGQRARPFSTLEDCRALVQLNAMAFLAGREVHRVSERDYEVIPHEDPKKRVCFIPGISNHLRGFVDTGSFPSDCDCVWGRPGGRAGVNDLPRLRDCVEELCASSKSLPELTR